MERIFDDFARSLIAEAREGIMDAAAEAHAFVVACEVQSDPRFHANPDPVGSIRRVRASHQ